MTSATPIPLALFARPPEPGRAKTRLARAIGAERAAALYAAFLRDVLGTCLSAPGFETTLWVAGDPAHATLAALAAAPRVPFRAQPALELGARMARALEDGVASHGACVVVGTDVPTLPGRLLHDAHRALEDASVDVVLGPSADGGFYLVGVRREVPPLFEGARYGTRHALTDTVAFARRAHARVRLLSPWYDVDTPRDLGLLRAHLATSPRAAPNTARALGLYVDAPPEGG